MVNENFELQIRNNIAGPFFTSSYQVGDKIESWEIEPKNQVTLKSDNITVLADVTEVNGETYKAKIIGFENYTKEELGGKKAGDIITFKYDNLFGCSR